MKRAAAKLYNVLKILLPTHTTTLLLREVPCTVATQKRKEGRKKEEGSVEVGGEAGGEKKEKILSFLLSRSQGNELSCNNKVNRHPRRKYTYLKHSFIFNT